MLNKTQVECVICSSIFCKASEAMPILLAGHLVTNSPSTQDGKSLLADLAAFALIFFKGPIT